MDLKEVCTTQDKSFHQESTKTAASSQKDHSRILQDAVKAFEDRVDEIVIENHDGIFEYKGDEFDAATGTKMRGFTDYETVDRWRNVVKKTLKRRLARKQKQSEDEQFYRRMPGADPNFSRESIQLFEVMEKGKRMADRVEFQFASQF